VLLWVRALPPAPTPLSATESEYRVSVFRKPRLPSPAGNKVNASIGNGSCTNAGGKVRKSAGSPAAIASGLARHKQALCCFDKIFTQFYSID
jgi:hypothetical protein